MNLKRRMLVAGAGFALVVAQAFAQEKFIVVASTTSTEQSGLFSHLLPKFARHSALPHSYL